MKPLNRSLFVCQDIQRTHSPGIFNGENPLHFSFAILMLDLIFIVTITRIFRFLLKPLKQPRFISNVLGGLMVGPSMLGRNKNFTKYIFPANSAYVNRNIGVVGYVYYLFLAGVKMDLTVAKQAGKKQQSMAAIGFLVPFVVGLGLSFSIRKYMDKELAKIHIIGVVTCVLALSSFPAVEETIREINLLSSEVGRFALATTIITDVVGINCITAFEIARQYNIRPISALWAALANIFFGCFVVASKQMLVWIIKATPEGKPVHEGYIVMILVATLVSSLITDSAGLNLAVGPFLLGLVVPSGPPLGSALVYRTETIVNEFLMPFGFSFVGMSTNMATLPGEWPMIWPMCAMTLTVAVAKFVIVYVVSRFHELPVKDSLALTFILSIRGQLELLVYLRWLVIGVIPVSTFSMLVLLTIIVTAISTPIIEILYDPTRPYMVNKRRAIQFTAPDAELRIVACLHDQESVAGFINLLEASNPILNSPFTIFALRLIELVGNAHPVFVDHANQGEAFELTSYNRIHNALTSFQESTGEYVKCRFFTSVSPTRTMYQDICKLAITTKATIIVLPFRANSINSRTEVVQTGELHSINMHVLSHAPCSVGILVDRSDPFRTRRINHSMHRSGRHFAVLYLGGPDCREALAYADRMASNPDISLSVVRFLSNNGIGDDPMEKKLDDGFVTWFWVKNEPNERVTYKESVVSDGSGTVMTIQAMMSECSFDMWIVGRKSGTNQVLIEGLSSWSKNDELGVIGDYLTSVDLAVNASVLVVQQQVLRGQEVGNPGGFLTNVPCVKVPCVT